MKTKKRHLIYMKKQLNKEMYMHKKVLHYHINELSNSAIKKCLEWMIIEIGESLDIPLKQ